MKTVIEMAREAGLLYHIPFPSDSHVAVALNRFAELVRADAIAEERDAVEELLKEYDMVNSTFAKDFRARSNT